MNLVDYKKVRKTKLPPIGLRLVKSAIAVFICFIVHILRGEAGFLFYSVSTAIFCMQQYKDNSKTSGKQRFFGTVNGGIWGCIVLLLNSFVLHNSPMIVKYLIISIATIFVIYTSVVLKKPAASYFSCVVFLSATVSHIMDANPYLFVFNRMLDTVIGIVVSILVNSVSIPKKYRNDILFVTGLDETLMNENEQISAYSKVELNRMLDSGAHITISTERTIPSLLEEVKVLKLNMPIIAYDGAVMYDIHKKSYIKKVIIPYDKTIEIINFLEEEQVCSFTSTVLQEVPLIYYSQFHQEVEEELYKKLRSSYYRNYIHGKPTIDSEPFYIMCIGSNDKIRKIYHKLKKNELYHEIRLVRKFVKSMEGYTFLKIYSNGATKQNMLHELAKNNGLEETITFGSIRGQYDIILDPNDNYKGVVKQMKQIYEIYPWQKEFYKNHD